MLLLFLSSPLPMLLSVQVVIISWSHCEPKMFMLTQQSATFSNACVAEWTSRENNVFSRIIILRKNLSTSPHALLNLMMTLDSSVFTVISTSLEVINGSQEALVKWQNNDSIVSHLSLSRNWMCWPTIVWTTSHKTYF